MMGFIASKCLSVERVGFCESFHHKLLMTQIIVILESPMEPTEGQPNKGAPTKNSEAS